MVVETSHEIQKKVILATYVQRQARDSTTLGGLVDVLENGGQENMRL